MSEDNKKWLKNKCSEYFDELKILTKKKEKYLKNGKEVPDKLNKRITECNIIFEYFNNMFYDIERLEFKQKMSENEINIINSWLYVPALDGFENDTII